MQIERAHADDCAAVEALLTLNRLPVDGLAGHTDTLLVARENGRVIGTSALEIYADGALLRSVAVDPAVHGRGIGVAVTEAALRLAADRGIKDVFLLTTTAPQFFPRFGFETITREDVPPSVRTSIEFTSVCCASAVVMRKRLP